MDEAKKEGVLLGVEGEGLHHLCSFMWVITLWIIFHSEGLLEQMWKDPIEEAENVGLEPKLASVWWTITHASEEKEDLIPGNSKGCYKFPFEEEFRILGCVMNRQGKTCDAVEERMQSANTGCSA